MITLDQIHILENKVNNALEVIKRLQIENDTLRNTLEGSQAKIEQLESRVNAIKEDQDEIEQGIINVLSKLDELEDTLPEADSNVNARIDAPAKKKKAKSEEKTIEVPPEDTEDIIADEYEKEEKNESLETPEEELDIF